MDEVGAPRSAGYGGIGGMISRIVTFTDGGYWQSPRSGCDPVAHGEPAVGKPTHAKFWFEPAKRVTSAISSRKNISRIVLYPVFLEERHHLLNETYFPVVLFQIPKIGVRHGVLMSPAARAMKWTASLS